MDIQEHIRQAIIEELQRQADNSGGALTARMEGDKVMIEGPVDLDELIMVIAGSLAGGP